MMMTTNNQEIKEETIILDGKVISKTDLRNVKESTRDQIREESNGVFKTYKKLQG